MEMSFNQFLSLYKRAERLSSAVFLVSNTLTDSQELRAKINSLAINLISYCAAIKDNVNLEKIKLLSKMESALMEISSLLDMASISGFLSPMNTSILKQEFDILAKDISELREYCSEETRLSNGFFKDNTGNLVLDRLPITAPSENSLNPSFKSSQKGMNNRKENREKAILDIIRSKGSISIKDISKSIRGCSEKTIQRKLFSLIQSGILKKDGERRWSRYSLVKTG